MKPLIDKLTLPDLIKSLIISLVYVGSGTVAIMSGYPSSPLYGSWVLPVQVLTLPVNLIGGSIEMFSNPTDYNLILIIQSIVFIIFWYIVFRWLNKRRKRNSNRDTTIY
jgi:hypothetical protein